MKKKCLLLFILLLLSTGCSVSRIDNNNIQDNIDLLLGQKVKNYNVNFDGYKYYVPTGLRFINKEEYNAILEDRFGIRYYLYVDAISYYHGVEIKHTVNDSLYYDQVLEYGKKNGYLRITEEDDKYFIEYIYNYAKVEAYSNKKQLNNTINNITYILRSIKFNDDVLESIIGDNVLNYQEETFSLFDEEVVQEDFLEVVSKYDTEYSKSRDQDEIELNDDTEEVSP